MAGHKPANRLLAALLAAIMLIGIMPTAAFAENNWGGTGVAQVQKDPSFAASGLCAMGNNLVLTDGSDAGLTQVYYADVNGNIVGEPIDLSTADFGFTGSSANGFDLGNVRLWGTFNGDKNAFTELDVMIWVRGGTINEITTGIQGSSMACSINVYMSGGTLIGENETFNTAITAHSVYISGGNIPKNQNARFPLYLSGSPSIGGEEGYGVTVGNGQEFYINGALSGASVYVVPTAAFADGTVIAEGSGYQITESDIAQLHLTGEYGADKELYLDGNAVKIRTKQVTAYNVWVGDTQVTEENAADVLGDGTVSYDAVTNTLTLNGLNLSDKGHEVTVMDDTVFASVFAQGDLNIVLAPGSTNTISTTGAVGNTRIMGVAAMAQDGSAGKVSVSGSGALSVSQTLSATTWYSAGIFGGETSVDGSELNFNVSGSGYTMGIGAAALTMQNADITCTGTAYGLIGTNGLSVLGDSHIKATGSLGALHCADGSISVDTGLAILGSSQENDFENLQAAQVSQDGHSIKVETEAAKTVEIRGLPAVAYLDESGAQQTLADGYTTVTSGITAWTDGWYVVEGDVTIDGPVTVTGNVKLILKDGANLTVNGGIVVPGDSNFTVYGQQNGTGNLTATGENGNAGIGGTASQVDFGTIILAAKGTITATGDTRAAGIGGGGKMNNGQPVNGTVHIYCGTIEATGGRWAAGIGGGADSVTNCTVVIDGGTVKATGGENNVGIGGTEGSKTITINGGSVTANGSGFGAGIGGSYDASGGTITITGGVVNASSIGGGSAGNGGAGGTITISGGIVTADRIGAGGSNPAGSFSTGESGDAAIFAGSITDQSDKANWNGLIFENGQGKIYGSDYTVDQDLTIPAGNTLVVESGKTLVVSEGVVLTNNGDVQIEKGGSYSGAQPDKEKVSYQIDWDTDGDGDVDDTTYVAYDAVPTHADGSKAPANDIVYTFDKWSPDVAPVTGHAKYTATFTESPRMYQVTIPQDPGYTVEYESNSVPYEGEFSFTLEIQQGYYQTPGFAVKANGQDLTPDGSGRYTVTVRSDIEITVEGVARETALAAPAVDTNGYSSGVWTAADVTLTPSATADSGIAYYEYSTDAGENWTRLAGASLTISESKPATDYIFRAVSNAGGVSPASAPVTVMLDKEEPGVTLAGNTADYLQQDTLKITPADALSGIAKVEMKQGDGAWAELSPSSNGVWSVTVTENGTYAFRATSDTGVTGEEESITYQNIDRVTPVVSVDAGSYQPGGWTNQTVALAVSNTAANLGDTSFLYKVGAGEWQSCTGAVTVSGETEGTVYTFKAVSASGVESAEVPVTVKIDRTAPEGDIAFRENSVKTALNQITFGLFFNEDVDVTITGADTLSGVARMEYYKSDRVLEEDAVQAIADWTVTDGSFSVTAEDEAKFIYYVKITDNAGNAVCFGSNGATFDLTAPVISGIDDGGVYYTTQAVAAADANLKTVTLNGQKQNASFALAGNVEESYTIAAVDMAGNETEYTVTMKPIEALADGIAGVTADTVTSADKAAIEQVKSDVAAVDTETATDAEKAELNEIVARCESLLAKLEEAAQAGDTDNTGKVENVTADNVRPENKEDLTAAKEDLEKALNDFGGNYTEAEKAALEEKLEQINNALESLEKAKTVQDAVSKLPDTVEPDETNAEALIQAARDQYEALTEHEKSLIPQALKEKLDRLLAELVDYRIIAGDNGRWTQGSNGSLSFTANGAYSKFTGIRVDEEDVDASRYTASSGSTIIALKAEYLNTLSVGKHTLTVLYTDGEAGGNFEIVRAPAPDTGDTAPADQSAAGTHVPQTGNDSQIALWLALLIAAVLCLAGLRVYDRRKKREE